MEVPREEVKKLHVLLDDIVSRFRGDIVAAEQKHADATEAFQKEAEETKKAKSWLDAKQVELDLARAALDVPRAAFDKAEETAKKESDEAETAKQRANDDSWKKEVQDLQEAISAVGTLRRELHPTQHRTRPSPGINAGDGL